MTRASAGVRETLVRGIFGCMAISRGRYDAGAAFVFGQNGRYVRTAAGAASPGRVGRGWRSRFRERASAPPLGAAPASPHGAAAGRVGESPRSLRRNTDARSRSGGEISSAHGSGTAIGREGRQARDDSSGGGSGQPRMCRGQAASPRGGVAFER